MNIEQQHKAAVAMANTPMIRTMTDYQLVVQHRTAKEEKNDVMRLAIEIELERRGRPGVSGGEVLRAFQTGMLHRAARPRGRKV
ncbi:Uncharacterised protein [Serratia quinivorans]|uniref:Uncharacterized protein n=1 Tax=Serratia quinivorans TaxID=137545 RepID=A0A380AVY6_9GAMM|nr:Uncharacterised protein [Serratia quinivorans]